MLHPSKDEDGNIDDVSNGDAVWHFISVFWKVLFSLCPPPHYGGGFPCFIVALIFIGLCTLVVSEIATMMGCILFIKPGVTAITFVAIGTSIPDTFASRIAAQQERYGDEADQGESDLEEGLQADSTLGTLAEGHWQRR